MNTYEIHILRKDDRSSAVFAGSHISDHAAVRRAHDLAGDGDVIEVWRGANCVYAGFPRAAVH